MQYRIFSVPAIGSMDLEEDLNHFLRSHKIISVQKTVEIINNTPHWSFCVEYLEGSFVSGRGKGGKRGGERIDYKEVLSEEDFAIFAQLRDVRKKLALAEAIPVYTVCTNEQLAAMATTRPSSLSDLKKIDGFGEAKAEKYGVNFLTVLNTEGEDKNETGQESD